MQVRKVGIWREIIGVEYPPRITLPSKVSILMRGNILARYCAVT